MNFLKIKNIFMVCFLLYFIFQPFSGLCREEGEFNLNNLKVRQERYNKNGVMFSGPNVLDIKIRDIILQNKIKSLADYIDWLKENITYQRDTGGDNWAQPNETLQRKYGDCEDLSFLNQAILRVMGIDSEVVSLMRLGANHAVCVFKTEDNYYLIDNTRLVKTQTQSLEELAKYIFLRYGCSVLCRVDFKSKKLKSIYKRSDFFHTT